MGEEAAVKGREPVIIEVDDGLYQVIKVAGYEDVYAVAAGSMDNPGLVLGGFQCSAATEEDLREEALLVLHEAFDRS